MTSKVCEIKYIPRTVSDTKNLIDYQKKSTKRMNECNKIRMECPFGRVRYKYLVNLVNSFKVKYELLEGEMSFKIRGMMMVSRHTVKNVNTQQHPADTYRFAILIFKFADSTSYI